MFTLIDLNPISDRAAHCTIAIDGMRYSFGVKYELNELGIEGISYFDIPKATEHAIVTSNYERDLVLQLCRHFKGDNISLPLAIASQFP